MMTFPMTFSDPNPGFKVTVFSKVNISKRGLSAIAEFLVIFNVYYLFLYFKLQRSILNSRRRENTDVEVVNYRERGS